METDRHTDSPKMYNNSPIGTLKDQPTTGTSADAGQLKENKGDLASLPDRFQFICPFIPVTDPVLKWYTMPLLLPRVVWTFLLRTHPRVQN